MSNVTGGQYKEGVFSDFDESTPIEFDYDTGLVLDGNPVLMHVKVDIDAGEQVAVFNDLFFPDPVLREYLSIHYKFNEGDSLSQKKLDKVTAIDFANFESSTGSKLRNLAGIEYFRNLISLDCRVNDLSFLPDLSKNPLLEYLNCSANPITSIDVSQNVLLRNLCCATCQIQELDLSKLENLEYLLCSYNSIKKLDLSNNPLLKTLFCLSNQLTSLDLSSNVLLETLACSGNQITNLDLSKNKNLKEFMNYGPQNLYCIAKEGKIEGTSLSEAFDISKVLNVTGGQYKEGIFSDFDESTPIEFDYDTGLVLEGSPVLMHVKVNVEAGDVVIVFNEQFIPDPVLRQYLSEQYGFIEGRGLTQEQLDQVKEIVYNRYENNQRPALTDLTGVEYFRNLTNLNVFNNELIALDVSKNTNLETLFCANNALTSLDVSKNLKLVDLDFSYNKIKNINVTQNTELVDFHTNNNQLENIDVSKNIHLIRLSFMNNLVKVLDISNNPEIESLLCTDNQLTHLDLSMNSKLSVLDCARNKLTMLDFSNNPDLEILCVEGNLLSKIDISSLGNLVEFICGYNQLTDLDISQNQKLKLFLCEKNILQALDVSKNPGLDILDCSENQLKELDLSNNMEMTYLKCIGNQLAGLDLSHTKISSIESSLVGNQTVSVPVSSNQLDFKSLFGFLDFSKILNVTGAEYANGIFTNFNFVEPVEYDYDTGLVFDGRSFVMHTTLNLKKIISVVFDEQYFPDPLFREYLAKTFGFVEGSKLSQEQLDRVTEISCSGLDSMDLNKPRMDSVTGIEHFRNLKKLDVSSNNLGKIDISNNTQLTELRVDYTKLSALDITNNPGLEVLWYAGNPIGNLDVSHLSQLRSLSCGSTNRSQLDVSSNPLLEQLFCGSNDLTELDLSNNGLLKELNASHNALRFLILPKTSKLEQLDCSFNQLEEIMLPERSNLIKLNVLNNGLKALNLANVSGLISLNCGGNQIVSLTISNLLGLEKLYCSSNPLGTLDVSANTALSDLGCANCQLKGLDVSQNKELTSLFCSSNELASLDLKNNPLLVELICDSNQLTKLDLSANSRLQHLGCADNVLTKLDVTSNPQLKWMYCANNALKTLDLSKNPLLNLVSCAGNQITYLDLSQNTNLKAFVIEEGEDPQTTMISVSSNVLKSGALAETLNAEKVLNVKGADYKNGMFSNFTLDTPIEYDYDTGINLNGEPVLLHVILSLEKEPVYLEWDEKLDFVYNEDQIVAPKLDVEGISDEKVSYTWEEKTENGWVKLDKAPTDAGSYRISAVVESENSEESPVVSKPIEFDIAKAENEGKLEMKESWTYGEEPPLPEIETKFESEVTYEVQKVSKARRMRRMSKLATQSLDFQMPTEAGEYMLVANVAGTKNVEALSLVAYFTILPKPAEDLKEPDESEIKDLEDFVLKNGDEPLIEGVDYEKETIQVGNQVTVRVNFKNNYSGTKEYTYTIHSTPDTPKPDQPKPDNPKPSQPGQDDSKPNPSGPNHSMPEHPEQNRPKPNQKEESSKSDLDSNQELVHLDVSQTSARQVIRVESISPNTSVETGTSAYWFGTITSVLGGLFSWKKRKKK
ncbi:leucine-rich repeat domain-containing protein [uncultured Dubosiella sp.]|uniref:leucine-rich repeat domain-containing protein n=1 Tax=uncultured Dubosiella sp. TaxID=1937011 RepID=UPI0025B3515C|nr:hypothetical protein [uncultured Dubosiella sp.]